MSTTSSKSAQQPISAEAAQNQDAQQVTEKAAEVPAATVQNDEHDVDYSVYGLWARRWIVLAASFAGFFSPLSGSIYYPALPEIAKDFGVSNTKINLTVTTYMIFQGLAPMITAGFSDTAGRRPAYMVCFFIYLFANIGLALQNNYAALMVLRCLQSAGSSGAIAIAQGVVSDIITPQERGAFIAYASVSTILGPTVSPIIGGLLSQYAGWRWIFWFLVFLTAAFSVPFFLFFPETCRKIVGNGGIFPPPLNRCLTDYIRRQKRDETYTQPPAKKPKLSVPNPLRTLEVFAVKQTAMILLPCGISFAALYAVLTGASNAFRTVYGFDEVKVALMYIPLGVGGIISAFSTGKLIDWNFHRHAKRLGITFTKNRRQDLSTFPLEIARLQIALPISCIMVVALVIYGWIIQEHYSVAGVVILMLVLSWTLSAYYQSLNVVLIDTYPGRGATVTAAVNIIRCLLGAVAAAVIGPMTDAVGNGWAYTIIAAITLATTPFLIITMKYGMEWRKQTADKEKNNAEKKRAKAEQENKEMR